jgi:hypothetical protein
MARTTAGTPGAGDPSQVRVSIRVHAFRLTLILSLISIGFAFAHLITEGLLRSYGNEPPRIVEAVSVFFNLNAEHSAPTWFSSSLWLLAALLGLSASSRSSRQVDRRRWRSLAALFAFLSLDESAGVHEKMGSLLGDHIALTGALHYVWVLYGILFLVIVALFYARFVASLPRAVTVLILAGALVFLAGALGVEMLSAAVESGTTEFPAGLNWPRAIALEETLEMLGVVLVIQGLLLFLRLTAGPTE